ncbi:RNA polymerase sigma factor, sigma-70 family [Lentimicrobium saccharophilum]|uniref:RNA polymerase sigma factor, sigma-70 family n=1 Tax=Lentimicrobium saccharophilum TaxID=1678841 RepID=A0A0S7C025_9BACT|nr:RNA polymerase sigma factor, sigma-70 family [Lentimicrobium saccharophilum]
MRSDDKLIKDCLSGNKQAQYELYQRFSGVLFGICLRYARNRAEAEDLLQEAFIKIFSRLDSFGFKGSFEGWLRRLVVNLAINFRRDYLKQFFVSTEAGLNDAEAAEESDSSDMTYIPWQKLLQMIQSLPDGYRMVFNMYVFENLSHQQIAELLEISENTSKTQLMKARKRLRLMVEAELAKNKISVKS